MRKKFFYVGIMVLGIMLFAGCDQNYSAEQKSTPASVQESRTSNASVNSNNSAVIQNPSTTQVNPKNDTSSCGQDYYKNVDGVCVHRPSNNSQGASAKCRDGSYSYSQHRQGTCSGHGGVAEWL